MSQWLTPQKNIGQDLGLKGALGQFSTPCFFLFSELLREEKPLWMCMSPLQGIPDWARTSSRKAGVS